MLLFVVLSLVAERRAQLLEDVPAPAQTSFKTETPTDGPDGFEAGAGGAIFVAFLLSLIGLGLSIWGSIFVIQPLVAKHQEQAELAQSLTRLNELGD